MILGLTGKNAAGKGEVANHLKAKGFIYYSLSDVVREEATKKKIQHTRENLIRLGNELREKYGPRVLAERINEKLKKGKNFVIDSIRNPNEVKELTKNRDFLLLGIKAPVKLRFERGIKRNRTGDAKTLDEFKKQEEKENIKKYSNQQLDVTCALAGKVIENNGSLEELHKKVDSLLQELKKIKI